MRNLIEPLFTPYLKGQVTLTELCVSLLDFGIEIDRLSINMETGRLEFTFREISNDLTYVWEIK